MLLTGWLVRETRLLREAETEPMLSVHLVPDERFIIFLQVVVENYGRAPALDLTWEISPDAKHLEQYGVEARTIRFLSELRHIAPGQRHIAFFGNANEMIHK